MTSKACRYLEYLKKKTDYKLRKVSCCIEFLHCFITNNLIPKFLNFNLYSQHVRGNNDYRSYQKHLLDNELQNKRDCKTTLQLELQSAMDKLKNLFTSLDFNHVMSAINNGNDHKISGVKNTQHRKLFNLRLSQRFENLSHDDVIFNKSDKILSPLQKEALSLGLKFAFNLTKLDYNRFFCPWKTSTKWFLNAK